MGAYWYSYAEISIHALRVEGDSGRSRLIITLLQFLSTPSGWRATCDNADLVKHMRISIHALRVEGDVAFVKRAHDVKISIHALRVEGDSKNGQNFRLFLRKRGKNLPF